MVLYFCVCILSHLHFVTLTFLNFVFCHIYIFEFCILCYLHFITFVFCYIYNLEFCILSLLHFRILHFVVIFSVVFLFCLYYRTFVFSHRFSKITKIDSLQSYIRDGASTSRFVGSVPPINKCSSGYRKLRVCVVKNPE